MKRLLSYIRSTLSVRLSLIVALTTALLLLGALAVTLHYARKKVRQEAMEKAAQTLEGTVQQIDNILLSVEQTAGNIYWNLLSNLDKPERMMHYSEEVLLSNPYITGCAIAMEPYYYKSQGQYFMAYVYQSKSHRLDSSNSPIIQSNLFGELPYNEQTWYTQPIESGRTTWLGPIRDENNKSESLVSFCLPIYGQGFQKRVGVMGVDVNLRLLTDIISDTKISPNSYCTMLDGNGTYIVHPDSTKLQNQTVFTYYVHSENESLKNAAQMVVSGQKGYTMFHDKGKDYFVFYMPFHRATVPGRAMEKLPWNVAIVYPEEDILGDYNLLAYIMMAIALVSLLLLLVLCQRFAHRQLLPLRLLTASAQRISEGHYDDVIPASRQQDEIGQLQDHFQNMQQALSANVRVLEQLRTSLQRQGEELNAAYQKAQEADRLKTAFLHNMTKEMMSPAKHIYDNVSTVCKQWDHISDDELHRLVDESQTKGKAIMQLLDKLLEKEILPELQEEPQTPECAN